MVLEGVVVGSPVDTGEGGAVPAVGVWQVSEGAEALGRRMFGTLARPTTTRGRGPGAVGDLWAAQRLPRRRSWFGSIGQPQRRMYRPLTGAVGAVGGNGWVVPLWSRTGHSVMLKVLADRVPGPEPATSPHTVNACVFPGNIVQVMEKADADAHAAVDDHSVACAYLRWAPRVAEELFAPGDGWVAPDFKLSNCGWFEGARAFRLIDIDGIGSDTNPTVTLQNPTYQAVPVAAATGPRDYAAFATAVAATAYSVEIAVAMAADERIRCGAAWQALLTRSMRRADKPAELLAETVASQNATALCGAIAVLAIYADWARRHAGAATRPALEALKRQYRLYFNLGGCNIVNVVHSTI